MNSGSILVTSDQFTDKDCFVGHSIPNKHNTYFRNVRNSHYPKYYGDESKLEDVTNLIINQIYDEGGRFLQRKQNSDNDWVVLDSHDDSISDCIKIALRAKYHNQKSYLKKGTVATTSKHLPSSTSKKPKIETNKDDDHKYYQQIEDVIFVLDRIGSCVDNCIDSLGCIHTILNNMSVYHSPRKTKIKEKMLMISSPVSQVYSIISRKKTGAECAYAGDKLTPIAGEITKQSMNRVVRVMKERMNFDSSSRVLDIGSGQGKPSLHFAVSVNPSFNFGVELVPWRWFQAISNLIKVYEESMIKGNPFPNCFFQLGNIRSAMTFDPFTHIYMFSTGYGFDNICGI